MNIRDAKDQIKIAMRAYFSKDQFGNYRIPIEKQRPIFLMGPPGIGKTAIMEQIAHAAVFGYLQGQKISSRTFQFPGILQHHNPVIASGYFCQDGV